MEFTYCKLNDVLKKVYSGGTPSTEIKEYWNGNIKWLSSGETSQRFISDTISKITKLGVQKSSTKLATKNSIVMACAGQGKTRGQTSFLLDDMYINQSIIAMQTNLKILPLYLFYNLSSRYEELRGGSDASSTRGSITTVKLKKLSFKYPDIDIQKKIATVLNNYDQLIENNNKRIKLLEDMAESLYKEWFVRFRFPGYKKTEFENEIPREWKIKKIKDVVKRLPFGKTYKETELLDSGEVMVIDQSTAEFLGFHNGEASHKASFENPILLFGDHTCKYQLMCEDFSLGENIIPYKNADDKIDQYYLFYSTKDIIKTEEYKRHWGRFINFKIFIPSFNLQLKYRHVVEKLNKEKQNLWNQNQILVKQRDSLLPRLMSGKLSVEGKEVI